MTDHWRILDINLSSGSCEENTVHMDVVRSFLGGRGLGVRMLSGLVDSDTDPHDAETPLIFTSGLLTGARVPSGDRFSLSTLSPLTNTVLDTNSGGRLGRSLKKADWDVMMIRGVAERPSIILVDDHKVEVLPAKDLWGQEVSPVLASLADRFGKDAGLAVIGPAGENRVRFASIMTERMRAMGRGGAGSVMGSKNLKAVVVKGSGEVHVADKTRLKKVLEESNRWLQAHPVTSKALPVLGTPMMVNVCSKAGIFPLRNFQTVAVGEEQAYSGERLAETFSVGRSGCIGCYIRCGRITEVDGVRGEGPEYESLWALGPNLGIEELPFIIKASHRCNELGMDTISTGLTISCVMELAEKGIRSSTLSFGVYAGVMKALENIAHRRDEGEELAEGSRRVAESAGGSEYAMQVKGMELPGYDPRGAQGQGLAYATSSRGGCHLRGGYLIGREILGIPKRVSGRTVLGKGGHVTRAQNFGAVADSLSACRFATFALAPEYWSRMVSTITGWDISGEDLIVAGDRIVTLERILNIQRGIGPEMDTLPDRLLSEPLTVGACKGEVVHLDDMLAEYYAHRDWPDGIPSVEKRRELGLQ